MNNDRSNLPSAQPFKAVTEKIRTRLAADVMRPIQAFRLSYLPLVMVYFAYGALGIIDVSRDMWIKESLTLSPAELAEISVWFGLPWTVKMVFGELVDTIAPDWILPGRDMPTCAPMSAFNIADMAGD